MKKIIITGASGLVGSTLINSIIDKKNKIITIDNLSGGKIKYLKNFIKNNKIKFINEDISKKKLSKNFYKQINKIKFDEVWLLAANQILKKVYWIQMLILKIHI